MSKPVTPYNDNDRSKKEQVTKMFDTIAGEYDSVNRKITLGLDIKWRKRLVQMAANENPNIMLDIATGTGDLVMSFAAETNAERIIGLDISPGMLAVGQKKVANAQLENRVEMVIGDSENLQFENNTFDIVSVSYGVRNFENLNKGIAEIYRVLKPGGKLLILETSVPTKSPFKQGYTVFSNYIVPLIGKLFSKEGSAYSYLSKSASKFPFGEAFNNILKENRFINVQDLPQFYGASTIYTATK